jgi:hypothetical protein
MEAAPALCNLLQSSDKMVRVFLVVCIVGCACLVLLFGEPLFLMNLCDQLQIQESALSCLGMLASNAHSKAEHMDMLCELKVVDTAMRMLEKDGWKTMDDKILSVCGISPLLLSL